MLLAGPSQTSYPATNPSVMQYSPASRLTISSSSTVSKSNDSVASPSSSNRFGFMKSLSSQLNRGTELLKQTVQRAIFSTANVASTSTTSSSSSHKTIEAPPPTAKPTPYHSDPHAVLRSCSVDSLHLEMCHVRPIRPYTLTPYRRKTGCTIRIPLVRRPENGLLVKFSPIKAKARFKLQRGSYVSAFSSLREEEPPQQQKQTKSSPKKATATKRKRSPSPVEEQQEVTEAEEEVEEVKKAVKRVKKSTTGKRKGRAKPDTKKTDTKAAAAAAAKRKSTEQEKQEREDFEMAKKLQLEFDAHSSVGGDTTAAASNGSVRRTRNGRSVNNSVTTNYSLRTTRSLSKISLSVSPTSVIEEVRNKKQTDSPPTKNGGLRSRNVTNGSKRIKADHPKGQQQPPVGKGKKTSTKSVGRATRSKVNGGFD